MNKLERQLIQLEARLGKWGIRKGRYNHILRQIGKVKQLMEFEENGLVSTTVRQIHWRRSFNDISRHWVPRCPVPL